MLFVEARFLFFFVLVALLYWGLPSNRARKAVLLISSYVFYGAWDYRFLSLILLSTVVDYVAALRISRTDVRSTRRRWLLLSLLLNLGVLFFFKYFNFFTESLVDMLHVLGVRVEHTTLNIVLPVGISFYTFQTMSYTIDVYRDQLEARKDFLDVAVFVGFFPQLVAGPIVRAAHFLPQLDSPRRFASVPFKACLALFLVGYFKKAVVSDNIAPFIDMVFDEPAAFSALAVICSVLLYAVQIYCDFSGYSDMAIGVAGLLGFQLPLNFDAPYFAASIADFWRRWHISLSSWLRDYLYIPLGGNRNGARRRYRNLMLTMLLGGLWHGASWNFVIWGGLHGGALAMQRFFRNRFGEAPRLGPAGPWVGRIATFYLVCLCWIFFRTPDLGTSLSMARVWLTGSSAGSADLPYAGWVGFALLLPFLHLLFQRVNLVARAERSVPLPVFCVCWGSLFALALSLVPTGYKPFIYFQF